MILQLLNILRGFDIELNYELVENKIKYFACTCQQTVEKKYQQALFDLIAIEWEREFNTIEQVISYYGLGLTDSFVHHLEDIGC